MTTQLDVINYMLSVVDETPVSDPESDHPTVQSCLSVLNRITKQVQVRGWWFNKEYGLLLNPDSQGNLILPSSTLKAEPVSHKSKLVKRGNGGVPQLYDPINHTFLIGVPACVNVTIQLNIEDLPETAAIYIQALSAYQFYVNDDGDAQKAVALKADRDDAYAALNKEELAASRTSARYRPLVAILRAGIQDYGAGYGGNPNIIGGGH